jgi:hypothetical protein
MVSKNSSKKLQTKNTSDSRNNSQEKDQSAPKTINKENFNITDPSGP